MSCSIVPPGYSIHKNDRDSRGGVVAICSDSLQVLRLPANVGIECVVARIMLKECDLVIGGFYKTFYKRLNFKLSYTIHSCNLMLVRDVPHVAWENGFSYAFLSDAVPLLDIMQFHDFTQLVKVPTHVQSTKQ